MSLYRADPAAGTVSIYKQETGKDWCNFLWNEGGFQCEITHTGASSSKFVSATAESIVLNEPKSGVVYFRDEETHLSAVRCARGEDERHAAGGLRKRRHLQSCGLF